MYRCLWIILMTALSILGVNAWDLTEKYRGEKYATTNTAWHADILPGYEVRYVNQGNSYDGPCRSSIIRKKSNHRSHRAYLYVHGFNDYFFQSEMGKEFTDSAFNFYAVDLRRYGRSREPWQYPFNVRNLEEYFADIDSAISQIRRDGNVDITLSGHSTGGLTVLLYAAKRGARCNVNRVVTNSPFVEWNFNGAYRNFIIPIVSGVGHILKNVKISQSQCDGYARSLHKDYNGEWQFNTEWKMPSQLPVTMSWISAIESAQTYLHRNSRNIVVPFLVMHSDRKVSGCEWTEEFMHGDAVLDPQSIKKWGEESGAETRTIVGGMHDLILSKESARRQAYVTIFNFIRNN